MQRFRFSSLGRRFESVLTHRRSTLLAREPRLVSVQWNPKFDSIVLPSVVHGLAPVITDVKLGNVLQMLDCTAGGIIVLLWTAMLLWSQRDISLNFQELKF